MALRVRDSQLGTTVLAHFSRNLQSPESICWQRLRLPTLSGQVNGPSGLQVRSNTSSGSASEANTTRTIEEFRICCPNFTLILRPSLVLSLKYTDPQIECLVIGHRQQGGRRREKYVSLFFHSNVVAPFQMTVIVSLTHMGIPEFGYYECPSLSPENKADWYSTGTHSECPSQFRGELNKRPRAFRHEDAIYLRC